jgi:hypothetical protein
MLGILVLALPVVVLALLVAVLTCPCGRHRRLREDQPV